MIIENTAALQFLITEDIYLAKKDVNIYRDMVSHTGAAAVDLPEDTNVMPLIAPIPISFSYLGDNKQQFLIVCHYAEVDCIDDKHLEALKSALQRKDLTLDDVAIINLAKHSAATSDELLTYFKPKRLLILGREGLLSPWDASPLNQLTDLGGRKLLYSYSFAEMMGDRDKTKAFWEQMKVL